MALLNQPLIAQYKQVEQIGFGKDEATAAFAKRTGCPLAKTVQSKQFSRNDTIPKLFDSEQDQGWNAFLGALETMRAQVVKHANDPYSAMRAISIFPKLLQYTWQLRYWINRDWCLQIGGPLA